MFAIFYKDTEIGETEHRFRSLMINKLTDIFVINSLNAMGWDKTNIKAYYYPASEAYLKFHQNPDENAQVWVNPDTFELEKIYVTKKAVKEFILMDYTHAEASNYYSQAAIDDWTHNALILEEWLTDNSDGNGGIIANPVPPEPDYNGVAWPFLKTFEVETEPEEYEIISSIPGQLIDIDARIALEEQAIADGKKNLIGMV